MKIQLIIPKSERVQLSRTHYIPPLGIMSIAAFLKIKIPDLLIEVINGELLDEAELIQSIKNFAPDILGISTNVGCYRSALSIAKKIKSLYKKCFIVLGGPYVSTLWKECLLNRKYIDCCVVDDGEIPFYEIVSGKTLNNIHGVAIRNSLGIPMLKEPQYPSLDDYKIPDWTFIDTAIYQESYRNICGYKNANLGVIYTKKGCKWKLKTGGCIFCGLNNPLLRERSPKNVWNEILHLNKEYSCNHFWEISDTICSNIHWLDEFLNLKPNKSFTFKGYGRASEINQIIACKLKQIGFEEIFIGVESGDDSILKSMNKGSTAKINLQATKLLAKNNIKTFASIVLGLPNENNKSLKTTYDHILHLENAGLNTLSICIFAPYPGSKAFTLLTKHQDFIDKYKDCDVFDWKLFSMEWLKKFTCCEMDNLLFYADKMAKEISCCAYEDNFTYIDRIYDI